VVPFVVQLHVPFAPHVRSPLVSLAFLAAVRLCIFFTPAPPPSLVSVPLPRSSLCFSRAKRHEKMLEIFDFSPSLLCSRTFARGLISFLQ